VTAFARPAQPRRGRALVDIHIGRPTDDHRHLVTALAATQLRPLPGTVRQGGSPAVVLSESVLEAVRIWWAAALRAHSDDPAAVADAMRAGRFEVPRGTVTLERPTSTIETRSAHERGRA
jgi:hypothetical protein